MLIFFRNQKRTEKENSNSLEVLKFETAGGDFPILMSPSPLGSPAAAPAGKVEEMRKYQKHNWIITTKDKKSVGFLISKRK